MAVKRSQSLEIARRTMPTPAKTALASIIPILKSSVLDDGNTRVRNMAAAPRETVPKSWTTVARISGHRLRILVHSSGRPIIISATGD